MLSFIKYLIEATSMDDELLGHLTHTKDIPHEAPSHVHTAIDLIRQFHNLRQGQSSTVSASIKHDGGAADHIIHEKDGRVGITDKHRLARGIVAYSDEDVDKHFGEHPDYAAALKNLRNHGHEIVTRGHHVQGDILWSHGDSSKREGDKVSYTPNRITYHAKSSAPIGIAIHTEVKNGVAQALSKKATKSSKNVFVPREDFNPTEHEYSDKDKKAVEHHLSQAEKLAENHTTDHLTPEHIEHLTIYHNRVARGHRKPTVEGYATYLRSRGATEAEKKKSSAGQQKVRDKFESMARHTEQNKDHFHRSIQIRQHLQAATDHSLNGIEHPDLQTTIDGKKSRGEGVVLRRKNNLGIVRPVAKLVHSGIQHALGNNPRFPTKGAINESTNNTVHHTIAFGRMNPPTAGHEKVVNTLKATASKVGGNHTLVLSGSHGTKDGKNPLFPEQKLYHAKNSFPGTNIEVADKEHPTLLHHVSKLYQQNGVTDLHFVGGSDRKVMYDLLQKYNGVKGAHGYYNFKNITFHSSGQREEGARGVTGISGTKLRGLAKEGNKKDFFANLSSQMKPNHKEELYGVLRRTMKEERDPMIVFRKFIYEKRLVPTRSSSKGGNGGGNGNGD